MKDIEYTEKFIKALEQDQQEDLILAFSAMVRASAHTAMTQILSDAVEFEPRVAPLLVNRVIALLYHSHFQMTIEPIEKTEEEND